MSDSLLLGSFELVDQSTGTPYQVVGDDRGGPVPDTATVVGTLLDGDRVTGHRSGNRTFTLPVTVTGASRVDVAAKLNALVQIVDQPSFTLTWTPDGGLPVVFDCLRGSSVRVVDANVDAALYADVTLTFPALPFGRSTEQQAVPAPGTSLQVDGMNSGTFTGGTLDTVAHYEGAGSVRVSVTDNHNRTWGTLPFGRTVTAHDLTGKQALTFRIGTTNPYIAYLYRVEVTLTDSHGSTVSWTPLVNVPMAANHWSLATMPYPTADDPVTLASGQTSFDWTLVTQWSLTLHGWLGTPVVGGSLVVYVDDLEAVTTQTVNSTAFGSVLAIPAIDGSARMPVNVEADLGGSVFTTLLLHSPPPEQDPDLGILLPLTSGAATVQPANGRYNGSYAVVVILDTPASGSRTISVDFNQVTGSDTHSPSLGTEVSAVVTGSPLLVVVGFVTLPVQNFPADNVWTALGVIVGSTGADTFLGVALCDTEGQTVLLTGLDAFTKAAWVDEPDPMTGVGQVYVSPTTGRDQAYSVLGQARTSGGPMVFEPGDNKLLAVSHGGAPNATVSGYPRWLDERTV